MKKLMIAAFAVAFAAVAQAATVNWVAQKGYLYDGAETPAKITSGTAYLMFVTSTFTQDNLISAFMAAEGDEGATYTAMSGSGALATGAADIAATARIPEGVSTYNLTGDASAYFVVFANDKMFVSAATDVVFDPVMQEGSAAFESITASSKQTFDAANGNQGAGWYAVPEPTSGLLMLLGMGALALRRRRA